MASGSLLEFLGGHGLLRHNVSREIDFREHEGDIAKTDLGRERKAVAKDESPPRWREHDRGLAERPRCSEFETRTFQHRETAAGIPLDVRHAPKIRDVDGDSVF